MNYRPVIYYRGRLEDQKEFEIAEEQGFLCVKNRTSIPINSLVIPRYSAKPFYQELSDDLFNLDCILLNTPKQFNFIDDLQNYVSVLQELTPETWDRLEDLPDNCSFVLKGESCSKKNGIK